MLFLGVEWVWAFREGVLTWDPLYPLICVVWGAFLGHLYRPWGIAVAPTAPLFWVVLTTAGGPAYDTWHRLSMWPNPPTYAWLFLLGPVFAFVGGVLGHFAERPRKG